MRVRGGFGAAALVAGVLAVAAPASAATKCKLPRHVHVLVLARSGHAVIWAKVTRHGHRSTDRLYVCVRPHGGTHFIGKEPGKAYPRVTRLQVAGHFVGFFLSTSAPFYVGTIQSSLSSTSLLVLDTDNGRVDMADPVSCEGSVCAANPFMTRYFLAPNGWVVERYAITDTHPQATTQTLVDVFATYAPGATRKTRQSVPLDFGSTTSSLALSGATASWTSDLSGASSAALGPSLIPSTAAQAASACQLLTASDLSAVLGPESSAGSGSQCHYSSQSNPSKSLSLSFKTGLSSQQVDADESALQNNSSFEPILVNYGGYEIYVATLPASGTPYEQLTYFAPSNGSEVSLELKEPSGNVDEQLAWLANVVFDHLFAIPVQRTA